MWEGVNDVHEVVVRYHTASSMSHRTTLLKNKIAKVYKKMILLVKLASVNVVGNIIFWTISTLSLH